MKQLILPLSLFIFIVAAKAQAPQLWATCQLGGALNYGAIIKSDSTGNNFQVVYSFDNINGADPVGNLCSGGNGKLYGITEHGGTDDSCVTFAYDTSSGIYTMIHDDFLHPDSGWEATSGMTLAADGMLYGLKAFGGFYGDGVLYRVDPSIDSYSPLYHFNNSTGSSPHGGLIQLSDGKLYGMTQFGGTYGVGVIFSFDPVSSDYVDLHDFDTLGGMWPLYGSLLQASDGKLYGLTFNGGVNDDGLIYSYDPINGTFADAHDFDMTAGAFPEGSLMQADNGLLYGMTHWGGQSLGGVIFSFDISTQNYSMLHNFTWMDGTNPERSLMQASNGKLFGTTSSSVFSFDITDTTFTKLIDFYTIGCQGSSCDILETRAHSIAENIPVVPVQNTDEFTTYPNPVTDNVTVLGKIITPKTQVELWNDQGKRILDYTMKGNTLNVSMLPSGFYILKVTAGNSVGVGKFMKQ